MNSADQSNQNSSTISLEELEKLEELVGGMDPVLDDGGESSVSGETPDVEADDNTLDNMHDVGLHLDESDNGDEVQPLDIAKDIEEAEKAHQDS